MTHRNIDVQCDIVYYKTHHIIIDVPCGTSYIIDVPPGNTSFNRYIRSVAYYTLVVNVTTKKDCYKCSVMRI